MNYRKIFSILILLIVLLLGENSVFSTDPALQTERSTMPANTTPASTPSGWTENLAPATTPVWRLLHTENGGRIIRQERDTMQGALSNDKKNSEHVQLILPGQSCILLGRAIDFPITIEDLAPSLFVKSNGIGVVLGAQVVLPNAIHPSTGKPITFMVAGSRYSGSGEWEKLEFRGRNGVPNLLQQVEYTAKLLRAELVRDGLLENVDLRDKYVRQIVLYVDGNPHATTQNDLWIDALHVAGHVAARKETLDRTERDSRGETALHFDPMNYLGFKLQASSHCVFTQSYTASSAVGSTEWKSSLEKSGPLSAISATGRSPSPNHSVSNDDKIPSHKFLYSNEAGEQKYSLVNQHLSDDSYSPASSMSIQLSERILYIDGIPRGMRAVEYQGEPLAFLRQLQFNAVWLKNRPTPELLWEAKNAGIWLICPPPPSFELESARTYDGSSMSGRFSSPGSPQIDPAYDNVLAWNIGDDCTNPNHQVDAQRVTVLQNADRLRNRPIICTARSGVREYSRIVDILMMDRKPILSSLDLVDLATWQTSYPTLARFDTPFWNTVQTDADPRLANQWILFGGNPQDICAVSHEQIKMQVYRSIAAGSHGLLFTSNTPLTNEDPATEYRRTSLELINWELQMLETWFASGRPRSTLIKPNKRGKMALAVIQSGRTRLLLPIWQEPGSQLAVGGAVEGPVKYVISGVPETYEAFLLVPGRLFPLQKTRVAGGVEIQLEEINLNSLIYFGEIDPVYASIEQNAKIIGERAAYLACRLAELQLASTEQVLSMLKQVKENGTMPVHPLDHMPLIQMKEYESEIRSTREWVDLARQFFKQTPPAHAMAYLQAERATRGLRVESRDLLRQATRNDLNACMTPVSMSFSTLPYYLATCQRNAGMQLETVNRLPCGDMENVDLWRQTGWVSKLHRVDGVAPPVVAITSSAGRVIPDRADRNGLRIVVGPTSEEEAPVQLETAPVWVVTPPVPVRMGELICVHGWVRVRKSFQSTVDGLMIFDSLGGEASALRITGTRKQWREFAFYRYVPADTNLSVVFSVHGLGEVNLDDIRISAVDFKTPQTLAPTPTPAPAAPSTWQRINPLQYLPPLPNWSNRQ